MADWHRSGGRGELRRAEVRLAGSAGSSKLGLRGGPDFDSIDDQTIYRDHPVHQRVITNLIAPIRADRAAVPYDAG
jgi:hypothetical protein